MAKRSLPSPKSLQRKFRLMPILRHADIHPEGVAPGRTRYLIHTDHLMTVVWDFTDGPKSQPDTPHAHPHEQTTYCAAGEVLFFLGDDEPVHLTPGDLVAVPGNMPHTIQLLTEHVRLIDTFNPLREEFLKK